LRSHEQLSRESKCLTLPSVIIRLFPGWRRPNGNIVTEWNTASLRTRYLSHGGVNYYTQYAGNSIIELKKTGHGSRPVTTQVTNLQRFILPYVYFYAFRSLKGPAVAFRADARI